MSVELCCIERLCPGSAAGFRRKRLCVLFRIRLVRFHWANRILRAVHGARHVRPRRAQHVTRAAVTTAGSDGKSTAGSTTAPSSSKTAPAPAQSQNTVELIGRFYEKGAGVYQFEWSGSTISAGFIGTGHRHQAAHDAALPRYSRRPRLPECLDRRRRTHGFEGEREHRPVSPGLRSAGRLSHRAGHQAHRGAVRLSAAVRGLRLRRRQACPGPGAQSPAHRGVRRFHFRRLRQRGDRPRAFAWRRKTPP